MTEPTLNKTLSDALYRSGDSNYMVSLARGLHLIQAFCEDESHRLTMAELTRVSGLSRTVVSRCLYTLQELGFVGRDGNHYFLLPKVLRLGYGYVTKASLPTLAQPVLDELTDRTGLASAIVLLDGDDALYVAKGVAPRRAVVSVRVDIGHRRPAYSTSSGLILLAALDDDEISAYFERHDDREVMKNTGKDKSYFMRLIKEARQNDFCRLELRFAESLSSISVPVRNVLGNVEASLVVAIYDLASGSEPTEADVVAELRNSAGRLSQVLVDPEA